LTIGTNGKDNISSSSYLGVSFGDGTITSVNGTEDQFAIDDFEVYQLLWEKEMWVKIYIYIYLYLIVSIYFFWTSW